MAGITVIEPNAEGQWITVSGNIDATGWTAQTIFGSRTVTEGGAIKKPGSAGKIDGYLGCQISDAVAAAGGVTATKLSSGVQPGPQYIMNNIIATQTTVAHHFMTLPRLLNPSIKVDGNVIVECTPGATDLGSGDSTVSLRFAPGAPSANLRWRGAEIVDASATDLLDVAPVALGGDTTFPWSVPATCKGIRGLGIGTASDLAAGAGMIVGQYRFQGDGLKKVQDLGGVGIGGEAAATSTAAGVFPYWDDVIGVNPGSAIDLLAGYTGTDIGTQTHGMALVSQE